MTAMFGKLAVSFGVLMVLFAIAQDTHNDNHGYRPVHKRYHKLACACGVGVMLSFIGLVWSV